MRHLIISLVLAGTGCSAAQSAMGVLSPKPQPVTVVNNVSVAPAPAPAVVVVKEKPHRSVMEKVGIVTTSTLTGAALGAIAGDALDADAGATALLGAGLGAYAGVAIANH